MPPAMNAAAAYAKIEVETGVPAASPHKLILMLFDGAIVSIARARRAMEDGDVARKGESVSRAIEIVEQGLRASLDKSRGGPMAAQLDSLYDYIVRRLLSANARNDGTMLADVGHLLDDLRGAWAAIENSARSDAANAATFRAGAQQA